MGKIIYYKEFDKPKDIVQTVNGKEYLLQIKGEYVCIDERVEKVAFLGTTSSEPSKLMELMVCFLFKDGTRHDKILDVEKDKEKQAEEFLQSIK